MNSDWLLSQMALTSENCLSVDIKSVLNNVQSRTFEVTGRATVSISEFLRSCLTIFLMISYSSLSMVSLATSLTFCFSLN
jgi:hypothetical protein